MSKNHALLAGVFFGQEPEEQRNVLTRADFVRTVRAGARVSEIPLRLSNLEIKFPPMGREISKEVEARVRREFERVLDEALPAYELHKLGRFSAEDETFIQQEVERLLYEPQMPNAGEVERRIIKRLKLMSDSGFWKDSEAAAAWVAGDEKKKSVAWLCAKAAAAVHKWAEVLPDNPRNAGRYYVLHPPTFRTNKLEFTWFGELLSCANISQDWDAKWFAELMLNGLPEPISNFKMECLFLLRKPDGSVDRLVRLENVMGEISKGTHPGGCEILEAIPFGSPEKFRSWCLSRGNFAFSGNQTHLQMIHEDECRRSAGRIVNRIDSCGWHFLEEGLPGEKGYKIQKGIWFYGDGAILPDGITVRPDEFGIFWYNGEGYFLNNKGRESEFLQKKPLIHPGMTILNSGIDYTGWTNVPKGETETDHLRTLFREFCQRFYESIGGFEAWLGLGAVFAYSAAPEIFDREGFFPGLWVHGQFQSGKTKTGECLAAIEGFSMGAGIGIIQSATPAGMLQEAENYSNILVWMDEFREAEVEEVKLAILRNAFNRQAQAKWTPDGIQRVIKTAFMVTGESTSSDAALRSRYIHIQVSAARRLANNLAWLDQNKRFFFFFGRMLRERRGTFVQYTMHFLDQWIKSAGINNDREKKVHGIAYAAWMAVCALLESHGPEEVGAFKQLTLSHLKSAAEDATAETNVNRFWQDVLIAFKAGAIPKACFKLVGEPVEHPPGMPDLGHWVSYKLYFDPNMLLSELQIFLSKQNAKVVLKRNDLRDQMKTLPYWIPLSSRDEQGNIKQLQVRLGTGKDSSSTKVWGIKLDLHPDGLQRDAKREDYDRFLMDDNQGDPRKGPLFAIVHALQGEKEGLP